MSEIPHSHWDGINHPYRMLEKHYNESGWNLVKENKVSVWGSFEPVEISDEINWAMNPLKDETWSFYFNGLSWLYSHLWAIDHIGEKPDTMFGIIRQYHKHVFSENPNKMVWFDHSTSDRLSIMSVISVHPCVLVADERTRTIIDEMLSTHIDKIIEFKDSKKWENSNHGVFHSLALLNASSVDSALDYRPDIESLGLEYLSDTLSTILSIDEKISLEQSAYYHQLAISLIESLEYIQLSDLKINKIEFIEQMRNSNYWLTCTDKKLIAIGDTSVISNISSNHSPVNQPKKFAKTYEKGGVSFAKYNTKNGWNHFSFLHRSERAPHGHFDALSITLSKGNKEFLIDSGGPYRYGDQLRFKYFMSSFAHNVAVVDGKKHETGAKLIDSRLISDHILVTEAEHSGYFPIKHTRKCIYVKNKGLAVIDSFNGVVNPINIQLQWHVHPNCSINEDISELSNGDQFITIRNNITLDKKVVSGIEGDNPQGWITPGIGVKEPCPTIIDSIDIESDTKIVTYFEYENGFFNSFKQIEEIEDWTVPSENTVTESFNFNSNLISKYISNDPLFWKPGAYFEDRNIWKIKKSQQKLSSFNLSLSEKSYKIKEIIESRVSKKIPTVYIISNGGSGCHYLGGLISMKHNYKLIDEVYFPPIIIDKISNGDSMSSKCLVEMVNFVHLSDIENQFLVPVNTMHLRKDTPLSIIRDNSSNPFFINLIRNPIDIAISRGLRKLDYKLQNNENKHLEEDEYLERQALFTKNHFTRLHSKLNDVGSLTIRFEDLIRNPIDTLEQVFDHIKSPESKDTIETMIGQYESLKDITKNKNTLSRPVLTKKQKQILADNLAECCASLGYEIPDYAKL